MDGTTSTDDPANQVILAPRRLSSAFATGNHAVGEALGLKDNDFAVFDVLNREGPRTPTELARYTRAHAVTMTGILAWLEGDSWIERRPDPADRRSVRTHAVGVGQLIGVYFRVNEELAEHISGWSARQAKMITRFLAGTDDIVTAFSERMTTEQES